MWPRARRVTLAAAVLGAGVIGVLLVIYWAAVRDHLEAWHFQFTGEMETIEPDAARGSDVLHSIAILGARPVIFAPEELREPVGCRIQDQRFPRKAWVIICTANAAPETIDGGWRQNFLDEFLEQKAKDVAK